MSVFINTVTMAAEELHQKAPIKGIEVRQNINHSCSNGDEKWQKNVWVKFSISEYFKESLEKYVKVFLRML